MPDGTQKVELRRFGLIMAIGFGAIGGLLIWKSRQSGFYLFAVAALFLTSALILPRILAPVERAWMAWSRALSVVMTYVVLAVMFFLVITPIGLVLILIGKDLLSTNLNRQVVSSWTPVEPDGPCTRPDKPY